MTLQLLRHDGQGRFVAAGLHCDILVFRARTGRVERVQTAGLWTGLVPDVRTWSEDRAFQLEPGDVMLLYTDGLIEAMNGRREQFDVPRLEAALARLHHLEAAELTRGIMADVRAWLVDQADDITLLALKRLPVAAPLPSPVPSR
jgi:serine phosphatase RsbU (regulator of sigma subunit)